MKEKSRVAVQNTGLVLGRGKSKRLSSMSQPKGKKVNVGEKQLFIGSKKEQGAKQARKLIEQVIAEIKLTYPQGRKNSFFTLRYCSDEKINQMSLQQLFTLFNISQILTKEIADLPFRDLAK